MRELGTWDHYYERQGEPVLERIRQAGRASAPTTAACTHSTADAISLAAAKTALQHLWELRHIYTTQEAGQIGAVHASDVQDLLDSLDRGCD